MATREDNLDDPPGKVTSDVHACNASIHGKRLVVLIGNTSKRSRHEGNKDSLTRCLNL
jgi:hypothetical protein